MKAYLVVGMLFLHSINAMAEVTFTHFWRDYAHESSASTSAQALKDVDGMMDTYYRLRGKDCGNAASKNNWQCEFIHKALFRICEWRENERSWRARIRHDFRCECTTND